MLPCISTGDSTVPPLALSSPTTTATVSPRLAYLCLLCRFVASVLVVLVVLVFVFLVVATVVLVLVLVHPVPFLRAHLPA